MRWFAVIIFSSVCFALPAKGGEVLISEVLYDAPGADGGHTFVELYGPPSYSLSGWRIQGVNGSGGGVTNSVALDDLVIPADGFLVLADADSSGATSVSGADAVFGDLDLQNGPDSVQLLDGAVVEDALGYGDFGPDQVFAGEGTPAPDVSPGFSLARRYADVDSNDNLSDFVAVADPTPGTGPLSDSVATVAAPEPPSWMLAALGLLMLAAWEATRRGRSAARRRPPGTDAPWSTPVG